MKNLTLCLLTCGFLFGQYSSADPFRNFTKKVGEEWEKGKKKIAESDEGKDLEKAYKDTVKETEEAYKKVVAAAEKAYKDAVKEISPAFKELNGKVNSWYKETEPEVRDEVKSWFEKKEKESPPTALTEEAKKTLGQSIYEEMAPANFQLEVEQGKLDLEVFVARLKALLSKYQLSLKDAHYVANVNDNTLLHSLAVQAFSLEAQEKKRILDEETTGVISDAPALEEQKTYQELLKVSAFLTDATYMAYVVNKKGETPLQLVYKTDKYAPTGVAKIINDILASKKKAQ